MSKLNTKENPLETILEFVFYGLFVPKNYEPSWLYRTEILHPREVKEVNEIRINEAEVFYSTDIISFNVTYDTMVIKTNSSLTYDSLLTISKRIVNVLRSNLKAEFNFNIRYHFKSPNQQKAKKHMDKLLIDSFWSGIVDDASPQSASISKSVQKQEFLWRSDINLSICRRSSSNGELIHIFFTNFLSLERPALRNARKEYTHIIGKFIRLDNELLNVMNRCENIAIDLAKRYFSKK